MRFVNVTWDSFWERLQLQYDCWDTHNVNHAYLKKYLLPYLDAPFGALMEDLDRTGRLDETLVVIMSEMGRTPRINANARSRPLAVLLFRDAGWSGHSGRLRVRQVGRSGRLSARQTGQPGGHRGHDLPLPGDRPGNARQRPGGTTATGRSRRHADLGDFGVKR